MSRIKKNSNYKNRGKENNMIFKGVRKKEKARLFYPNNLKK